MKKNSLEDFLCIVDEYHDFKYDYTKVVYVNNYSKIEIICPIHGSFWQTPKNHYRSGCKLCADVDKSNKNFVKEAEKIHDHKYDYSNVIYINQLVPVSIICSKHGSFDQLPKVHLNGSGCRRCYDEKPKHNYGCLEDFILRANQVHGGIYDYSACIYVSSKSPIVITCEVHGEFSQTPNSHLMGSGCSECAGTKKLDNASFIFKANLVHDDKYNYSLINYINCLGKLQIICPIHGIFFQIAQDHLGGHGCHKCYKNISKMETNWLDSLFVLDDQEHRNVYVSGSGKKKYKVDGFDPINNTIFEFYGDFWHGNPTKFKQNDINLAVKKTFGELYNNTLLREKEIQNLGYNVVSIWELDWLSAKGAINEAK